MKSYKANARKAAANFIEALVKDVDKLMLDDTYGFAFARYIGRTNHNIRCISGFLPILMPEHVFDRGESISARRYPEKVFAPIQIGVPISAKVWQVLTVYYTQDQIGETVLGRQATFEQVKALWLKVASRYRTGELDDELVDEKTLLELS